VIFQIRKLNLKLQFEKDYPVENNIRKSLDLEIQELKDYELYKTQGGTKSLEDFRRDNINKLITKTYEKTKRV
jgi:hypothetical protein